MPQLPSGTVTFLFTDIEGSTQLVHRLGDRYDEVLTEHRQLLRRAFKSHGGHEVSTQGDSFVVAFAKATDAVAAAVAAQCALAAYAGPQNTMVRLRIGVHTGEPLRTDGEYQGIDVNRAARLCSAAHGGQVLLSQTTRDLVEDRLPSGVSLRDLGEHRLRDLSHPFHIYQLVISGLPADFPPPKTLNSRVHNLPAFPTPLVDRVSELDTARNILLRQDVRLVTLTGPGGTGKSRLALQIALELLDSFADGVFFISLAPLGDASQVITTVAHTLGLQESGGAPSLGSLQDYVGEKRLLLILDNFEHLLAAAPALPELLSACPNLKILVTSRAVLRLRGEYEFPVLPLAVPRLNQLPLSESLTQYASVELFTQRALAVQPGFTVTRENAPAIAEICNRLDGLPLAIELAAARVKVLSPQEMLKRLDNRLALLTRGTHDLLARHKTLRGTIAWSYDLLDDSEKSLFARMSVFAGGSTLEAVEAVCNLEGDLGPDVLNCAASLIDKSLLLRELCPDATSRLTMLETVREYAQECLRKRGESEVVKQHHARYYTVFAEQAAMELRRGFQQDWLDRLEMEHNNIRAALAWTEQKEGELEIALRLGGSLWRFWFVRGYLKEGRDYLERLLARCDTDCKEMVAELAKVVTGSGFLAFFQGEHREAASRIQKSIQLCEEAGDTWHKAFSLGGLGITAQYAGEYGRAQAALEEGLRLARQTGDKWLIALVITSHWPRVVHEGSYRSAEPLFQECLTLCRQVGDRSLITWPLVSLGTIALMEGQHARAGLLFKEGLSFAHHVMNKQSIAWSLEGLAETAGAQHQWVRAARLYGAAEALRQVIGCPRQPCEIPMYNSGLAITRAALGEQQLESIWSEGQAMTTEEAVAYAVENE